jgi:hypothetical protein
MAGLAGISSSPPYSDEDVQKVTELLNSGKVSVTEVSKYFNAPVATIIENLTGISRDAYTSGDAIAAADVDAVMKMVNSGVASVADVADYFSATEAVIESYLTDVELYTPEDIANVRQGVAVSSAAAPNIAANGDYTEAEIQQVADSINNGLLSTAQVAQQFNVPESEIISNMEIINQRNAEANAAAAQAAKAAQAATTTATTTAADVVADPLRSMPAMGSDPSTYTPEAYFANLQYIPADGDYTEAETQAVQDAIASGAMTAAQVAAKFGVNEGQVTQEIKRREAVQAGIDINNPIGLPYEGYVAPDYSDPYAIPADGNYTEAETQQVTDAINNGTMTAAQAAAKFGVTEAQITAEVARRNQVAAGQKVTTADPYANTTFRDMDAEKAAAIQAGGTKILTNPTTGQTMEVLVNDPRFAGLSEAEQIALVFGAAATTTATTTAADVAAIPADGNYTEAETQQVTDAINNGTMTAAQAAAQFGVTEAQVTAEVARRNQLAAGQEVTIADPYANTTFRNMEIFSGNNTAEDQGANADQAAISAGGLNTTYNTGAEIPTGLRGSEMALQGGAAGAIQMLDQINQTGRGDLVGRYNAGLTAAQEAATTAQGYISPYQQAGTNALQQQLALSGALGQDAFNAAYQESPQMAFLREQGMRANLAGAAATGGLGGGNVQKELTRFGQGLASQGLQNQIGNLQQIATQGYNAGRDLSNISTGLGGQQLSTQLGLGNQLTQLGLSTGLPAASTITALGNNLATGRTRVGEQLAGQYGDASRYLADTYSQQGSNIAGLIGSQANNINVQNEAAANNAARGQVGYGSALSGIQSNMGSQISDVPNTPIAQPNYSDAIGNALQAGAYGYNLFQPNQNQFRTQQQANYANGAGGNPAMINAYQPNPLFQTV